MKKIIDIKKSRPIPLKIIIGAGLMDGRTRKGKPIKKITKVLDFTAYLIACATIAFIITSVLVAWIA